MTVSFCGESRAAERSSGDREVSGAVPFFSQAATFDTLWPLIEQRVNEVFDGGKFSHGPQVATWEKELADATGARFAVGVNSGTDALVLLLRACGLSHGEGVLVPAYSFVATASSVVLAGGRPQFVDIDPTTYAMDAACLEAAVTPESRFVMPAHLFHQMADMPALSAVAAAHGLTLLEDSAEAIGIRQDGRHAGLFGRGGVLSFFPSKTLGALGDAGAVITDDPEVAGAVGALRHHGRFGPTLADFRTISTETGIAGWNSKMDDIQAAVLSAKLTRLEHDIGRRAEIASAYDRGLREVPGITRLPRTVERPGDSRGVFYVYLVEVDDRDGLVAHLESREIGTEVYYPTPLHLQPAFADLGYARGDFPHAEAASGRAVALPLYPDLTPAQVDGVCAAIREFYVGRPR